MLIGTVWDAHGQTVAMAKPYLPLSFGHAPRNLALKINSGYKAWEFMLYLFRLGPALLHSILEYHYWRNYCKFIWGVLLLYQRKITPEHVRDAHPLLCEFARTSIFSANQNTCIFQQSIHPLTHMGPETIHAGPLISYSQWGLYTAPCVLLESTGIWQIPLDSTGLNCRILSVWQGPNCHVLSGRIHQTPAYSTGVHGFQPDFFQWIPPDLSTGLQ